MLQSYRMLKWSIICFSQAFCTFDSSIHNTISMRTLESNVQLGWFKHIILNLSIVKVIISPKLLCLNQRFSFFGADSTFWTACTIRRIRNDTHFSARQDFGSLDLLSRRGWLEIRDWRTRNASVMVFPLRKHSELPTEISLHQKRVPFLFARDTTN